MKKFLTISLLFSFLLWGAGIAYIPANAETTATTVPAGSVIKTASSPTLYYVGDDNKLYVFPNANTYFSWFDGFTNIITVSDEDFAKYALGGNVYYRPGSLLVKTPSSLKVYAVGMNGELRWVENETVAKTLYGDNWNLLVDDVPDSFFTSYKFGDSVKTEDQFNPEEEAANAPTINHNKGFRKATGTRARIADQAERRCQFLQKAVNKLQKRAQRWGMDIPTLGDDYMAKCVSGIASGTDPRLGGREGDGDKKVTVCKEPRGNAEARHTITISRNALKKGLKDGYTLGPCEGQGASDDDGTATGTVDVIAPVISAISVNAGITGATVTWTTNEKADSKVEYDDSNPFAESHSASDLEDVTSHSLVLSGLSASTTYYFTVKSVDPAGNVATSAIQSFVTKNADATAPVISAIEVIPEAFRAFVSWATNEAADSTLKYSASSLSASGTVSTITTADLETSHDITITNLATSTKYYFVIESKDQWGNKAVSSEQSFTTDAE